MSSRRFDQFDQFVFVVSYRIQPPQNVCLDDRDRFLFERRLDIANVPFHASKVSDISERASRSDYTHEENSSLIRSVQGTCGRAWRIVGAIFNDCNECWKVSIEDRVYGTIVLYRIILYGKCNCEEWFDRCTHFNCISWKMELYFSFRRINFEHPWRRHGTLKRLLYNAFVIIILLVQEKECNDLTWNCNIDKIER